ncbi:MAG TPA: hypothetical protein P5056_02255 [Candidatus Paceibacterota bacterium]|nr:hypothetical protein [Candidatus Paceibacterota bacterium]
MRKIGVLFSYNKDVIDVLSAMAEIDSERLGERQSLADVLRNVIRAYIESRSGEKFILDSIIERNRVKGCQCYRCTGVIRINPLSRKSAVSFNLSVDEFEILRAMAELDGQKDGPESISDQIHGAIRNYIKSRSGEMPMIDGIVRRNKEESEERLRKLLKPRS